MLSLSVRKFMNAYGHIMYARCDHPRRLTWLEHNNSRRNNRRHYAVRRVIKDSIYTSRFIYFYTTIDDEDFPSIDIDWCVWPTIGESASETERLVIAMSPAAVVPLSDGRWRMWRRSGGVRVVVRGHVMVRIVSRHQLVRRWRQLASGWRVSVEAAARSCWSDADGTAGTYDRRRTAAEMRQPHHGSGRLEWRCRRRWRRTAGRRRAAAWAAGRRLNGQKMDGGRSVDGWRRRRQGEVVTDDDRGAGGWCTRTGPAAVWWHAVQSLGEVGGSLQYCLLNGKNRQVVGMNQVHILKCYWCSIRPYSQLWNIVERVARVLKSKHLPLRHTAAVDILKITMFGFFSNNRILIGSCRTEPQSNW